MKKGRIESSRVSFECIIRIKFLWRKDQIYTRHCSKQTSKLSQLQSKKIWIYLQLISSSFSKWTEVNLRTWINRWWEWIILSLRLFTVFWRKHCRDSPCQTSFAVFQKCTCAFFSYVLSNWQVSDVDRYL